MKTILTVKNSYVDSDTSLGCYERLITPPSNEQELLDLIKSIDVDHFYNYQKNADVHFEVHTLKNKRYAYHMGSGSISNHRLMATFCKPNWWLRDKNDNDYLITIYQ